VLINGTALSVSESNGNIFIKLSDGTGNLTVVMFERTARGIEIPNEGDNITVTGQVNTYKGEVEIIANSIKG
jgi:DNA/RNA endonuclease YhcR with UshA esterase domain